MYCCSLVLYSTVSRFERHAVEELVGDILCFIVFGKRQNLATDHIYSTHVQVTY